jgi:putative FmdB family regulatory protein
MPTYEYKCEACGFAFEKFQSIKAGPVRKCPHCRKNRVKRLISSGAGLIFKGAGFYITDYRSESYKSGAKADSGAASPAKDSKPASGDGKSGDSTAAKPVADAKPAAPPKEPSKNRPAAPPPEKNAKAEK